MVSSSKIDIIYCHGLPGSSDEIVHFIPASGSNIHTLKPLDFKDFEHIISSQPSYKFHIIGFSLGAMTALKIAALYPQHIRHVSLIAPSAPLDLGEFLPHMAGEPVFKIAAKGSFIFSIFTAFQRLGVALAPTQIIKTMFVDSPPSETALLSNTSFEKSLLSALKSSLGKERKLYRAAILAYVQPWAHQLKNISSPVTIYHGTHDNWVPIEMSYALVKNIKSDVKVLPFDGLGHYAALHKAMPLILK